MAYTCAVFPEDGATLEQAQEHKFDLVCRKLGLKPGMKLLDVGCGWGGMVAHAVRHYGVEALGVTLSREQAQWAQKNIVALGLADRAEIRHLDYRDVTETGFDAISSIGLTEHIGARNVPGYFRFLAAKLKPHGRLLNHCITNPDSSVAHRSRGFIDRYVFPDGELEAPGELMTAMHDSGLEVRHSENLREHYATTLVELVRQPRRALGRGRRRGRGGPEPGVGALPRGLPVGVRTAGDRAPPDPRRTHRQPGRNGDAAASRLGRLRPGVPLARTSARIVTRPGVRTGRPGSLMRSRYGYGSGQCQVVQR